MKIYQLEQIRTPWHMSQKHFVSLRMPESKESNKRRILKEIWKSKVERDITDNHVIVTRDLTCLEKKQILVRSFNSYKNLYDEL